MTDVIGCLACDLARGRIEPPGGTICAEDGWVVEHCVGPLGVGALIVKPSRHVTHVWELTEEEAGALGPLLRRVSGAIAELLHPDQVYVCLWSHAGWTAGHLHFVLQPVWDSQREAYERPGPFLQAAMFDAGAPPDREAMAAFAVRARSLLGDAG
jgi:diadenosine tetraphosphate (Ap4A) HIT family hydrolase